MTADPASVEEVGRAISAALTPAFLLAGAAGMLNVLSQRRNRVVDWLRDTHERGDPHGRLAHLRMRARFALLAMLGCILSCILVSLLVCVSFLAQLYGWRAGPFVTALMLGAMLSLAAGLCCFLFEAALARSDTPPHP